MASVAVTAKQTGRRLNKTYEPDDLCDPSIRACARRLSRYARRMFFRGEPFAVNGVLRRRFYVRQFKMWEYARGLACADITSGMRVFDFGGGATLPVFYLAEQGCEVVSVDINQRFINYTNDFARRHHVKLTGSSVNLCDQPPAPEWGSFDRVISFCVIEHVPQAMHARIMRTLASLLRPGGVFVLTFDYGHEAPSEWPIRSAADVERLVQASGLHVMGETFTAAQPVFALDKRHPTARFTMGSVFLTTT
jgi:2-polyprenyl-3-methyl-5-hydroxy-6-metoxy-1,4-benzoquinol methylase